MALYYIDTSALVKRYHVEHGIARIDQLFADPTSGFVTANITLSEITSALDRKHQEGALTFEELSATLSVISQDFLAEFWLIELDRTHVQVSQSLIVRHHLRTLDSFHLAVLLSMREADPILVSADQRLVEAARNEQMAVLNPTAP